MLHVLALGGRAGSGKTTIARRALDLLPVKAADPAPLSFAGPLKEAARILWDLSEDQTSGDQKEVVDPRWGVSPRQILQHLGTEHGRALCEHVHVRRMTDRLEQRAVTLQAWAIRDYATIDDLRFDNEVFGLRTWARGLSAGGGAVDLKIAWLDRLAEVEEATHASEMGLSAKAFEEVDVVCRLPIDAPLGALDAWWAATFDAWGWPLLPGLERLVEQGAPLRCL